MLPVEDQHMIQALSAHTPQKAFTDRIGTRGVIGRFEHLDATRCRNSSETETKLAIMIAVDHFPRLQFDDEEGKERAKEQVSNLEEVAGPDLQHDYAETSSSFAQMARGISTPRMYFGSSVCRREYPASVIDLECAQPPKPIVLCHVFYQQNCLYRHLWFMRSCFRLVLPEKKQDDKLLP